MTAPIELYYWPTPNGWKITIMLEELGVPYVVKYINIGRGDQFQPDFLKISPNNRMPAIVDPDGPGGEPISVFESGAILQYLGRNTASSIPPTSAPVSTSSNGSSGRWADWGRWRGRHTISAICPERIAYGIDRYTNEVNRLYGVMNKRLADRPFLAGDYSIADMAAIGWVIPHENQGQDLNEFPNLKRWFDAVLARPAVKKAIEVGKEERARQKSLAEDEEAQKVLFGQRAR